MSLNLVGKNRALVAEGSYIVNTSGCNDCHTNPNFEPDSDPQLGQPEKINAAVFLGGGRAFGPWLSRNLTPNAAGLPAGMTFGMFVDSMRNGVDLKNWPPIHSPNLLRVMPWWIVAKHTDSNLHAIYEYLRAIPCVEGEPGNPTPPVDRCTP